MIMAEAVLCSTLVLTAAKTFFLVDEVFLPGEGSGVVARATKSIHQATSVMSPVASPVASPAASPRQRARGPAAAAGASKVRYTIIEIPSRLYMRFQAVLVL